jgi:hypothetical protein
MDNNCFAICGVSFRPYLPLDVDFPPLQLVSLLILVTFCSTPLPRIPIGELQHDESINCVRETTLLQ